MRAKDKVRHIDKPGEPFAGQTNKGTVHRVTPAVRGIPALALVLWGDIKQPNEDNWDSARGEFETWEKQAELVKL